jgi:hypothetical protein
MAQSPSSSPPALAVMGSRSDLPRPWRVTMPRQIHPRSCREISELVPTIAGWEVSIGRLTMNDSNPSSSIARPRRAAWNKGKLTGPKPPLRPGHVWSIRARLQLERHARDLALFNLAIDSNCDDVDRLGCQFVNGKCAWGCCDVRPRCPPRGRHCAERIRGRPGDGPARGKQVGLGGEPALTIAIASERH